MAERTCDRICPIPVLGLKCKVQRLILRVYANTIGARRSLVRSRCTGSLGGSTVRYAKVKEAGKTLMSAQSSSFKVRWRGAPAGARRRSGLHGGL